METVFRISDLDPAVIAAERQRALALIIETTPSAYVHEVGSTAVEGLIGKQDLDFLVRVPAEEFAEIRAALDRRFARNPEQLANEAYQGYIIESTLDVAVQLTVEGGAHDTFLTFLHALRESETLRTRYNNLKRSFDGRSMTEYRDAKRAFIESVVHGGGVLD